MTEITEYRKFFSFNNLKNILFDPDCGLGKLTFDNAYKKLELMCTLNKQLES